MGAHPRIDILVLNHNGEKHLDDCFSSLVKVDFPKGQAEFYMVDNGSRDGSIEMVKSRFPWVRIIRHKKNLGFSGGYSEAVKELTSDYIVFLNNDVRVHPGWLKGLLSPILKNPSLAAASSKILDWTGERIDFVGGLPSFYGHSWQIACGETNHEKYHEEKPLLFPCGCSMLIKRDVFLESGGFDDDFFAYFEDVDLGWRLNILGYNIVFAPGSIVYHRLHGTAEKQKYYKRLILYERNALFTIYKNYEEKNLRKILPAAILMAIKRAWVRSSIDSRSYLVNSPPPPKDTESISRLSFSYLAAIESFAEKLEKMKAKRDWIQKHRKRTDEEIFHLFEEPFKMHELGEEYREAFERIIRNFKIGELFQHTTL